MGNTFTGFNRETFFTNDNDPDTQASLLAPGRYAYDQVINRDFVAFHRLFFYLSVVTSLVFVALSVVEHGGVGSPFKFWLFWVNVAWLMLSLFGWSRFQSW
jgi:hypothetical protein